MDLFAVKRQGFDGGVLHQELVELVSVDEYIHLRGLMQLHAEAALKNGVKAFNDLGSVWGGID